MSREMGSPSRMRAAAAAGLVFMMARAAEAQFSMGAPQASGSAPIHDIAHPIDVLPYPPWMLWTAGILAALVLAGVVALVILVGRTRPAPAPPTPREIALRRLREAEAGVERMAPYGFSIQVSDILRHYVSAQYDVHATEQTSPEFLAEASRSPHFSAADKRLLAEFLERCDLIKFARVEATAGESRGLLEEAVRFVKGEPS